jgi:hypothetical protein
MFTFGCLNVRSLLKKFDDVTELKRDYSISALCMVETWHDENSAVLSRLRSGELVVVDRARPRAGIDCRDQAGVNHAGIVVIAVAGVLLSPIDVGRPASFKLLAVRVVSGHLKIIVAAFYRPGFAAFTQQFYDEFSEVCDRVAISVSCLCCWRINDQLRFIASCYGFQLKVLSDIHHVVDRGDVATLVLLDLSAAFDAVDHDILQQRMSTSFVIQATAKRWLRSYLINRKQFVRLTDTSSSSDVIPGVPQGSVLRPLLFILYTADLIALTETRELYICPSICGRHSDLRLLSPG